MNTTGTASTNRSPSARFEVVSNEMAIVLRQKSPAERLQISHKLWHHAVNLLQAQLRQQHPEWTGQDRSREIARRMANGSW